MITDCQTNFVYLADCLPYKYIGFSCLLEETLQDCSIKYGYIPGTRDVWAVDYMPIQVKKDKLVQFVYNPDYLQGAKKWRESISNVDAICSQMGLKTVRSSLVVDGGNVVRSKDAVIMCNKVFKENPTISEKRLIRELEGLFEVDKIIFVPQQPKDIIGHADGMVRFLDESTVLINDYSRESQEFQVNFRSTLHNAGLSYVEIPYNPYGNRTRLQAVGIYINFLQMQQDVLIPTFGLNEDDLVVRQFEELFSAQTITTVHSSELAQEGGVLNCISWNILK